MLVLEAHAPAPARLCAESAAGPLVAMPLKQTRRHVMQVLAQAQVPVQAIAGFVPASVATVRRWIRRGRAGGSLCDAPRTGRPPLYGEDLRLRLVAFYCQTEPMPGAGRWTLRWAATHLRVNPARCQGSPSKSTVQRILKDQSLKPHQSRYFLHITDPDFFPKLEHLIRLYRDPPPHLYFFDECPGIQILKRLTPDLKSRASAVRLEEFEYIRNGTLDVFAFLDHATGRVYLECQSDHTTDTLLGVFRRHVEHSPTTGPLHYVMDNLSSHSAYPLCALVAELSGVACPSQSILDTQAKRRAWLSRDDKRLVIHFTPFHGSWLNLVEVWFSILARKVLRESFDSPAAIKGALEAFTDTWNTLLAHPFQWSYDGHGLHDKAVLRFTQMLGAANSYDIRILTKQMRLVTNLLNDDFDKVSMESWTQFADALAAQAQIIDDLIDVEPGPQRKKKAREAVANLHTALQQHPTSIECSLAA